MRQTLVIRVRSANKVKTNKYVKEPQQKDLRFVMF